TFTARRLLFCPAESTFAAISALLRISKARALPGTSSIILAQVVRGEMADVTKEVIAAENHVPPAAATGIHGFIAKFTVLKIARRELWLTFLIKLLIYTAYSITNKTLTYWLSADLGFSDQMAGALVGWVWAPAMTVFTLLAGSLTDAIGLRRTFFLGVAICTF